MRRTSARSPKAPTTSHEIVVLAQRERLTSVALFKRGSGRYAAKLESCGVDLRLCFDAKQSVLPYSALGSVWVVRLTKRVGQFHRPPRTGTGACPAARGGGYQGSKNK